MNFDTADLWAKDKQSSTFNKNNAGLTIAYGDGSGVIFGELIFDSLGVGIAVGALISILFVLLIE